MTAKRLQYTLRALALGLTAHAATACPRIRGAHGKYLRRMSAVRAGCGQAPNFARSLLFELLETMHGAFPGRPLDAAALTPPPPTAHQVKSYAGDLTQRIIEKPHTIAGLMYYHALVLAKGLARKRAGGVH